MAMMAQRTPPIAVSMDPALSTVSTHAETLLGETSGIAAFHACSPQKQPMSHVSRLGFLQSQPIQTFMCALLPSNPTVAPRGCQPATRATMLCGKVLVDTFVEAFAGGSQ
jgi:hypothetical protein